MLSLACVQAKLRWALEPVLATLVKDTQVTSVLFLKIPTSSSSRSSIIVFCRRLSHVYSCWRNQDVLRGLKPTGLVLLMAGSVSSSLAKLSNPSNDLGLSWTGSLRHLAMDPDECALCQGSICTWAAPQCWEGWLLALLRGKFRAKNWEFVKNKTVCSIAAFEYWNKLPCAPVWLCLLDKVSI